ncbi:MAG TPA: glycosyltransferase [Flavobacterium sp.]|nr:glycosyltransferase [Flavobacterium sp.]
MENNLPFISVIVPNYNHEKYLKQRLDSIFNQTYTDFEVIFLDDCSTDNSREILNSYADNPKVSHCVFNEKNSGNTFIQWNKGIALARGTYIWIAESDDFCEPSLLSELTKPILADGEIALVYCQSNRVDESGTLTGNWVSQTDDFDKQQFLQSFIMDGNKFVEKFLIRRNVIPNASAVLFRKNRVTALGYLAKDSSYRHLGDWLFYLKMIVNQKIAFIHEPLNNFRYHPQSVIASGYMAQSALLKLEVAIKIRLDFKSFLHKEKPQNMAAISKINHQICREKHYGKALFYIFNNQKIKGYFYLLGVLDIFLEKRKKHIK